MIIRDSLISLEKPSYFIAEIGSNFDGSLAKAKNLISLAKSSGADAVKFQHYTASSLISDKGFSSLGTTLAHQKDWEGSVSEVYDKASLDVSWTKELSDFSHELGLDFITSPYSIQILSEVSSYIDAIKIGSGDITFSPLLKETLKYNLPVLLATGASNLVEVEEAMSILLPIVDNLCIMQCNTNYQSLSSDSKYQNLNVLNTYSQMFPKAVLGLSCHAPYDNTVSLSIALGARIFEKHFTDSNSNPGPDHGFALEPSDFKSMVSNARFTEILLGSTLKKVEDNEKDTVIVQRRAIRARRNISSGELIDMNNIQFLRPCPESALTPAQLNSILGRVLKEDIFEGDYISTEKLT
ncbi:N-acetylneuraminate synthase family protein [bacterium]|nr:N-acetylneuraminate synthase family protein [bacterium]